MTTLRIETPRVFAPFLKPSRYKAAFGGRGSGKSHNFAELGVERGLLQPGFRMVCVREVQKSLKDSVKLLIEDKIRKFELENDYRIMSDYIITPGNGLVIFQGMADHTADQLLSDQLQ